METSRVARDLQPLNMEDRSVTLEVSKPETSSEARELQSANMESMLVALEVSKWETSRAVREPQPENMTSMLVALEVSKWETSRAVREPQPENMTSMSVTLDVSSLEMSQEAIFRSRANQSAVDFGDIPSSTTDALAMASAYSRQGWSNSPVSSEKEYLAVSIPVYTAVATFPSKVEPAAGTSNRL